MAHNVELISHSSTRPNYCMVMETTCSVLEMQSTSISRIWQVTCVYTPYQGKLDHMSHSPSGSAWSKQILALTKFYSLSSFIASRPVVSYAMGTPGSSTRKLISASSFHRLDMTLTVAEALNPNEPNYKSFIAMSSPTNPLIVFMPHDPNTGANFAGLEMHSTI